MRSDHSSGKSVRAMREIDSAIWARMVLSVGAESAIMAGTRSLRMDTLSCCEMGASSCSSAQRLSAL